METKELLQQLNDLLKKQNEKLVQTHQANTAYLIPSYTEGWLSPNQQLPYIDLPKGGTIYIYHNREELQSDLKLNLNSFDPYQGADDQYYDYNPSQLESIIYAAYQLNAWDLLEPITNLLNDFIDDQEQDEDMQSMYQSYLENIKNHSIKGLEGYEEFTAIKNYK